MSEANLVGYYPLNDGAGTVVRDCSGRGNDGTVISSHGQMWTNGMFGGAFATTASAGCIDLGKPADLLLEGTSFTVSAWGRADAFGTSTISYYLVGRTVFPDSAGWRLGTDPGNTWSTKLSDTTRGLLFLESAGQQSTGVWTHVVAVYASAGNGTNGAVTLYVNGAAVDSSPFSAVKPDNGASLRIGCRGDNQGYFRGAIDEVRIYNRALSAADVAALSKKVP
ncbi:MAG: LamG domain-containing protein [Labilithrix sp.]|nr:LamG domain-containing protein [Labilithrix sp.]MCW5810673.1 LamG domain-containing protein [Labilithrix sp.]